MPRNEGVPPSTETIILEIKPGDLYAEEVPPEAVKMVRLAVDATSGVQEIRLNPDIVRSELAKEDVDLALGTNKSSTKKA